VERLVHRLKSLAVPVGLAPADPEQAGPPPEVVDAGGGRMAALLPRWMLTLVALPRELLRLARRAPAPSLGLAFDDCDTGLFADIAARFGHTRYGYAVTANADHLVRLHENAAFRALYADATHVLLDSRFLSHVMRVTRGRRYPVCTGSDLTAMLLEEIVEPHDRIVLIGGSDAQAKALAERHGLERLAHYNPPMGFIGDPAEVEKCLEFIERHSPFRFCFLAVGSPQQEIVAQHLTRRGRARGLALCIGASVDFLTGVERRAPRVLQAIGCEWIYRLVQAPRRMAYRYLVRGPRVFALLRRTRIELRDAFAASLLYVPEPQPSIGEALQLEFEREREREFAEEMGAAPSMQPTLQ
jgi:exopolysaccharide biosynthesis WecB/TagA/CpsF family protein